MKKGLLVAPLLLAYASVAATLPALPVFDPFTDATASGGTSYAPGSTLWGQTNALGQNWFGIYTSTGTGNAITNTGYSLSYNGLPGFSGQAVLLRNVAGAGARMFFAKGAPLNPGASGYYCSAVLVASNINNLSTSGQEFLALGTYSTLADQTGQPNQGAALWLKQVGTSPDFGFQVGVTPSGSPGTPTFDTANTYTTNQTLLVVLGVESTDYGHLWVNPDPTTLGASTEPAANLNTGKGALLMSSFTCAQLFQLANSANNLYVTAFRMGTNWSWVTGGPGIGQQPVASTNCPTGSLNLTATAMDNGTANGYQWQFNGVNLTDGPSPSGSGATVSGATTASLSITGMDTSAAQRDSGSYTVVVTNAYGAVTSSVAAVTANSAPVITTQPSPANLRLYAGASNALSVVAIGFAPLSYYWYSNNTLIPEVTTASFPIFNAQANANIYCVVSNSIGTATSTVVALTVVPAPIAPYPVAVLNDHPLSFWPLSEGPDNNAGNNGTLAYDYAGGNNGFYTNVYLGHPGYGVGLATQYGYSPATDTHSSVGFGTFAYYDSYVAQIPNLNFGGSQASSFSVEAWANGNNAPQTSGATIINKGYGTGGEQFTLDYVGAGWRFYVRNAAGTTITAASTNTIDANWHHLVGVVDAGHSNVTLYVDGLARAVTTFNPSAGLLTTAYPVVIGSRTATLASMDLDDTFYGDIQNVAIYNSALSPAQVASHYYAAGIGPSVSVPSVVSVDEGTTLVVPASVTGSSPLAYQWSDVTFVNPGTALAGQTNASLVISNISAADFSSHSLALSVTNPYGQVTGGPVYVQVLTGAPNSPVITPAAQAVYAGSLLPVPFTITAQGTHPFSYQWSLNGVVVPGATDAVFTNVPPQPGIYTLGCVLNNSYGAGPLATASLTVRALPTDFYASTVLSAGPMAFWRLDEAPNATTAYDYVGGHHATYTNALNGQPGFSPTTIPWETATLFGNNGTSFSFALENNNSAAGIPLIDFTSQGANAQFSVEAWIQAPPQSGGDVVCKGYPNNTQFAMDTGGSGGAYRFVIHNSAGTLYTANSGSVIADGQWHHLVGVCDEANGVIRMYADGSLRTTTSVPPGSGMLALASSYPVTIAAQQSQNTTSFTSLSNACISQVAIYSYALPTSQVVSNFYAATYVPPTLSAALAGTNLVFTYSGTLVWSTNVAGPFTNVVPGAVSPYTLPMTNTQVFFRARSIP